MASIVYEAKQLADRLRKEMADRKISNQTYRQYKDRVVKFAIWCRERYGCRHIEECPAHLQDYSDWLVAQGYSPNTVHKYLAGASKVFGVPLDSISKPRRVVADNTRSRGVKAVDSRSDAQREASPRLYDFALAVGIRRNEYKHLCGNDLVVDESGYPCVRVRRGKGGKYQEQRIAPKDVGFVRSFFDGSEGRIFSDEEMKNKIDLHHLRALRAQRAYHDYLARLKSDPDYRAQLTEEVRRRWVRLCSKRWDPNCVEGNYCIRGNSRRLALAHGLPVKYDRLAVMAVSIFHLSHWRCDVTVANYLLAV